MFNFFSKEPNLYNRIDNPGGGDCGYYALMMGIIHLAKSEDTANVMQATINTWKRLDPDATVHIDTALSAEVNILDISKSRLLMHFLQQSLRQILANHYKNSIPQEVDQLQVRQTYAYDQFKFLVEWVHPGSRLMRDDIIANPLCAKTSQAVREVANAIDENLGEMKFPHNPMYETIAHEQFIAASFVRFRETVQDAYQNYYVGTQTKASHEWATEKCLLTLVAEDCLNIPVQIFVNGRPGPQNVEPLIRLNNENNAHWTLYLPKEGAVQIQAAGVPQNIQQATLNDKKNYMLKERARLNATNREYLLQKEPQLQDLLTQLDEQSGQELETVDAYEALTQQYMHLNALHGAHAALDKYMAQHGAMEGRLPYDEQYLRLELERCQLNFDAAQDEEQKRGRREQIQREKDQLKIGAIQAIRANQDFQRQVEALQPIKRHHQAPQQNQQRSEYRPKKKLGFSKKRKPSSAYPGYALNACFGGFVLGAIIVGSSPELIAATAGALSFSPIGAVFMLLVASMIIATMLTLLTLYMMEKSKPSVAPTLQIR